MAPPGAARGISWAVVYPAGSLAQRHQAGLGRVDLLTASLPVHPSQLYEALVAGLLFGVLWARYPRRRHRGEIVFLFLLGYGPWRFPSQYLRADPGALSAGLDAQQVLSLVVVAVGVGGGLLWLRNRGAGSGAQG